MIVKIAAVVIGAFVLALVFLAYRGWIDVHWQTVQSQTENFVYNASAQVLQALNEAASKAHPSFVSAGAEATPIAARAGFLAGLTLGIRR